MHTNILNECIYCHIVCILEKYDKSKQFNRESASKENTIFSHEFLDQLS
jgi:hypothetical protein